MSKYSCVHLLAPHSRLGWVMRFTVMMMVLLLISFAPEMVVYGRIVDDLATHVSAVLLLGTPMVAAVLWCLHHLDVTQRVIRSLGVYDRLTGVLNRDTFVQRLDLALPQSGVLLLLDIDHLRRVNDALGHAVGDRCLIALAQRFGELTRYTDILGRLDGATFAIYLPGAPVEIACAIGDRLSEGLHMTTVDRQVHVTVSVGAVMADGLTPIDDLIRDAGHALSRAKMQGRARLVLSEMTLAA